MPRMELRISINEGKTDWGWRARGFHLGRGFIAWCLPKETAWRLLAGFSTFVPVGAGGFCKGCSNDKPVLVGSV